MFVTWEFLQELHDGPALGRALVITWLANTLALPLAGVIAEARSKRKIILACQVSGWICATAYTLLFFLNTDLHQSAVTSAACLALLTICVTMLTPLEASIVPVLFEDAASVAWAFRLKGGLSTANIFLGPGLSSFLIASFGGTAALYASFFCYALGTLFALCLLLALRDETLDRKGSLSLNNVLRNLRAGLWRAVAIPEERVIGLCSAAANAIVIPYVYFLLPMKIIAQGLGMMSVAATEISLGLSSGLCAVYLVKFVQSRIGWHRSTVVGFSLIALGVMTSAYTTQLYVICFEVALVGCGICIFNVTILTARSLAVPAGFRSAMEASLLFLCVASIPLGFLLADWLVPIVGTNTFIIFGSISIFLALAVLTISPHMRDFLQEEKVSKYYSTKYDHLFGDVRTTSD